MTEITLTAKYDFSMGCVLSMRVTIYYLAQPTKEGLRVYSLSTFRNRKALNTKSRTKRVWVRKYLI